MMPFLALFVAMFFWGTSFSLTKEVLDGLDPVFVMLVRLGVASLVFLLASPWIPWAGIRRSLRRGDTVLLTIMVLSEPCLYFLFETYALKYTTASSVGVMAGLFPLTIAVGASIFFREFSRPVFWIGCLTAVGGVVGLTLVSAPEESAPFPVLGNMLMFGAVLLGTTYTLIASKVAVRLNAAFLTALQAWGGALFYLVLSIIPLGRESSLTYSSSMPWSHWPESLTMAQLNKLIFLGVCVSVGSYGLFAWSISRIRASTLAILINFIPVMALIFAAFHLNEPISSLQLSAIFVILAGVFIAAFGRQSSH